MEGLRFEPSIPGSSHFEVKQDFSIGKYTFKQGDAFQFFFQPLHFNKDEWQRPEEFLPQRFDPDDPLYKRPDGGRRNPYSWIPFSGGKRVCFGKTFADFNMKVFATYLSQFFNFEYAEPEKYKNQYPRAYAFQLINPPVKVRLTKF